jgi:hypothetical protein
MDKSLHLAMQAQPDDTTCGPTCLHAVYDYFDDPLPLEQVIRETPALEEGGTLAVLLGRHALRRGYAARIYTYNLRVFDPTWFKRPLSPQELTARIRAQLAVKTSPRLHRASAGYIEFLELGGEILMQDLTASLLRGYLERAVPILTGLSATYLYQCEREIGPQCTPDDIKGFPCGHFVVLCGYGKEDQKVRVADPYIRNPLAGEHHYEVDLERLVCAILLGVLTYDANLLILEPKSREGMDSRE